MHDNHINYVEFYATDLEKIKAFYSQVFGWSFTDYGPTYTAFSESGLKGGFEKAEEVQKGGPLLILYHHDLEAVKEKILTAGGSISKDTFSFPGGKRFQFLDPAGNELSVWMEVES